VTQHPQKNAPLGSSILMPSSWMNPNLRTLNNWEIRERRGGEGTRTQ